MVEPFRPYFERDNVTIYHGDCCQLLRHLSPHSVDVVVTDPPYLVAYKGRRGRPQQPIIGDRRADWIMPAFVEIWRVLKPNSLCLSFYGWPHADLFLTAWKMIGFRPVSHIVCVKDNIGFGHYTRSQHETAYLLAKGQPRRPEQAASDVWTGNVPRPVLHPNEKPLQTISQFLALYTHKTDCILDPFMGSGTTMLAARNVGRRAIGIEIDERHCAAAVGRLAQERLRLDDWVQDGLGLQQEES